MTGGSVLDSLSIPIMIVLYCFYLILNQSARVKNIRTSNIITLHWNYFLKN